MRKTKPNVVEEMLNKLDLLLKTKNLHPSDQADSSAPVSMGTLLEDAVVSFQWLPSPVLGISTQWDGEAGIIFSRELKEPSRSDDLRYGQGHEFGHIFGKHRGQFIVWKDGSSGYDKRLDRKVGRWEEGQADMVAAYGLVSLRALREMSDMDAEYIARVLDVPKHLVDLRYEIWRKYGK